MNFDPKTSRRFAAHAWRQYLLPAWPLWLVLAVCLGLASGGAPVRLDLRYDRVAVAAGQWWRLFTGNYVHLGWPHVLLDAAGLVLLWLLCGERLRGWRWILATIAGSWAIGLGLWWAWPQTVWYVGISGVAHTYWAAGALLLIVARRWEGWALLVFLGGKLAWEQVRGAGLPSSVALMHEPVLVTAHLIGAIAGMVVGIGLIAFDYSATSAPPLHTLCRCGFSCGSHRDGSAGIPNAGDFFGLAPSLRCSPAGIPLQPLLPRCASKGEGLVQGRRFPPRWERRHPAGFDYLLALPAG